MPDREREIEQEREKIRLKREWYENQEQIKNETLDIIYSYWDGVGHRRKVAVKKGDTVGKFLAVVQKQLASDFKEVRTASCGNLIYFKEDIILPHHYTFYELILNKARCKSGPLFEFGVKEDIRLQHDASREKAESHAGKVVDCHWYEKNKHIFPASRWEKYDPKKNWDRYTLHDQDYRL